MRPTRLLAGLAFAGAAAALGLAALAAAGALPLPLARAAALFLAAFGFGKLLLGIDALAAVRAVAAGGPDPRLDYGRPLLFRLWVAFKLAAGAGALAAAGYLWRHPGALSGY